MNPNAESAQPEKPPILPDTDDGIREALRGMGVEEPDLEGALAEIKRAQQAGALNEPQVKYQSGDGRRARRERERADRKRQAQVLRAEVAQRFPNPNAVWMQEQKVKHGRVH